VVQIIAPVHIRACRQRSRVSIFTCLSLTAKFGSGYKRTLFPCLFGLFSLSSFVLDKTEYIKSIKTHSKEDQNFLFLFLFLHLFNQNKTKQSRHICFFNTTRTFYIMSSNKGSSGGSSGGKAMGSAFMMSGLHTKMRQVHPLGQQTCIKDRGSLQPMLLISARSENKPWIVALQLFVKP
jgi:hypothetical protein